MSETGEIPIAEQLATAIKEGERLTAELAAAKRAWECAIEERNEHHAAELNAIERAEKAEAERDELRELLAEAVQWLCVSDLPCAMTIHRINAALKGAGDE